MSLEIRNLNVAIESVPILHNVSLNVGGGQMVGLIGHNGAGKTTLIRTLMGLLEASAGSIRFNGTDLLAQPGPRVCRVKLDPDQPTLPRVTSYQRPDGSMATRPMEDMFPLLDREELRSNLFIPESEA